MQSLVFGCIFTGANAKRKRGGSGGHSSCVSTAFYNNYCIDRSKWTMLYNIQNTCGRMSVNNSALFNPNKTYIIVLNVDRPVAVWGGEGYV